MCDTDFNFDIKVTILDSRTIYHSFLNVLYLDQYRMFGICLDCDCNCVYPHPKDANF